MEMEMLAAGQRTKWRRNEKVVQPEVMLRQRHRPYRIFLYYKS